MENNNKIYPIYSAGKFISTNRDISVKNPYNDQEVAQTFLAEDAELEEAILKAISVKEELRKLPSWKRNKILLQIAGELEKNKDQHAVILSQESGKPYRYAIAEIGRAIETFRIAAEESLRIPMEYFPMDRTPAGENKEGLVRYFPIGVVAGISPFNFPLNLAVHKIAPAIASGCPILLKPSSSTPLSTLLLANIIDKTELPKGSISILPMNRETGWKLVTDERIKLLSFTGSPEIGWEMKARSGKKKVVLELGGNAGVIITPTADLKDAVKKCVMGGFSYSGQVCIHTQRIYLHDHIFGQFAESFIYRVRSLKMGDPLDPDTEISVMIDELNAIRVEKWINEAVESGASLLCGGKRRGSFIEPCVLTDVNTDMKVCREEVFGPVVVLEKYTGFSDAIEQLNNSRFGLQAGVFTDSANEMNEAFHRIETGGVIINDVPTYRADHMPYGGIKDSGLGREGVRYAMMDMLEPRILVKNC